MVCFSTNTTYTDPAASNTVSYFKDMLAKGYHLGPLADMDNHNSATMGKSESGKNSCSCYCSAPRAAILDGILNMRFYATEDLISRLPSTQMEIYQWEVLWCQTVNPTFTITSSDPDGETTTQIRLWYGVPGSNSPQRFLHPIQIPVHSTFTPHSEQEHIITTRKSLRRTEMFTWTSPIWYTKLLLSSPDRIVELPEKYLERKYSRLQTLRSTIVILERSTDAKSFEAITYWRSR